MPSIGFLKLSTQFTINWPSPHPACHPHFWAPPTLTSSSYVPANREYSRCWNKLNCSGVGTGGRESAPWMPFTHPARRGARSPSESSADLRALCVRPELNCLQSKTAWVRGRLLTALRWTLLICSLGRCVKIISTPGRAESLKTPHQRLTWRGLTEAFLLSVLGGFQLET